MRYSTFSDSRCLGGGAWLAVSRAAMPLLLLLLVFPWEGYILNARSLRQLDMDSFELAEEALCVRARMGSDRALESLLERGHDLDGGFALSHSIFLSRALTQCGDARFAEVLRRMPVLIQDYTKMAIRDELQDARRRYPVTCGPSTSRT